MGLINTVFQSRLRSPKRQNIFEKIYSTFGRAATPVFLRLGISPNAITLLSGIMGSIGAVCLLWDSLTLPGLVLIQLYAILDLVDGDVARARNMRSIFGHWMDTFFDKLNESLIILFFCFSIYMKGPESRVFFLSLVFMASSLMIQFVMLINHTELKLQKNEDAGGSSPKIKGGFWGPVIVRHALMGHSTLLFLTSLFVLFNERLWGLYFMTGLSVITLTLMTVYNFVRLWRISGVNN